MRGRQHNGWCDKERYKHHDGILLGRTEWVDKEAWEIVTKARIEGMGMSVLYLMAIDTLLEVICEAQNSSRELRDSLARRGGRQNFGVIFQFSPTDASRRLVADINHQPRVKCYHYVSNSIMKRLKPMCGYGPLDILA